jgi:hypothetical protein
MNRQFKQQSAPNNAAGSKSSPRSSGLRATVGTNTAAAKNIPTTNSFGSGFSPEWITTNHPTSSAPSTTSIRTAVTIILGSSSASATQLTAIPQRKPTRCRR